MKNKSIRTDLLSKLLFFHIADDIQCWTPVARPPTTTSDETSMYSIRNEISEQYSQANFQDEEPRSNWVVVRRFKVPEYVEVEKDVELECDYTVHEPSQLYSLKWYKGSSQFYEYIPSKDQQHTTFSVQGLRREQVVS